MADWVGRYRLLKKLAVGGMAEVYIAKQKGVEGFEKLVVIKMLLPKFTSDRQFVTMFLDEARLAARLSHPNVVHIYDLGLADGKYYIAMEYIHGENLSSIRKTCRKNKETAPLEITLKIFSQACEGLHHAHTKTDIQGNPLNIVHCDISPQNILVSYEGVAKVVDFGVAKAANLVTGGEEGQIRGKLAYLSPEQCKAQALDGRSDIFSMGIVLWELITGRQLFGRLTPRETLKRIAVSEIPSPRKLNPQLPVEVEAITLKALAKDPNQRFQTAYEMHTALDECMKNHEMNADTLQVGSFLRVMFSHKMEGLQRIMEAEKTGVGLEAILFDDILTGPSGASMPGGVAVTPSDGISFPRSGEVSPVPTRPKRGKLIAVLVALVVALGALAYVLLAPKIDELTRGHTPVEPPVTPPTAKGAKGIAKVTSEPAGATVSIDGKERCKTPCEVPELELGIEHDIEISTSGYYSWNSQFSLESSRRPRELHAVLEKFSASGKRYGKIHIVTDPPGATVELDGKRVRGKTPLTIPRVTASRRHKLRAQLAGRKNWVTTFVLQPNQSITLEGKLDPKRAAPGKMALLTIRSTPKADVFVDHVKLGTTPLVDRKISPGSHLVQVFSQDIQKTKSMKITARPGESINKSFVFEGTLVARGDQWTDVYLGGKKLGTVPVKRNLKPGTYNLTFKNSTLGVSETRKVVIKAGKTSTVTVKFVE